MAVGLPDEVARQRLSLLPINASILKDLIEYTGRNDILHILRCNFEDEVIKLYPRITSMIRRNPDLSYSEMIRKLGDYLLERRRELYFP